MKAALLTDLYELTMMQGYLLEQKNKLAIFDMFFRRQPFGGGFTIFAGLEPLLETILTLSFSQDELDYLDSLKIFRPSFLHYLAGYKFCGSLYAPLEGSVVFANEPILRIEGSLIETQLIESLLLNTINFQSLIATKSARMVNACRGGLILEFGLRRAQGFDGALSASRAAFIGGASATSNVAAGRQWGIPVKGTMAHSWVMSHDSELESFQRFAAIYPDSCILLIDTYDTLKSGLPNAITVLKRLKEEGRSGFGVRLDSGDLAYLSREVRHILDENDLGAARIIVSNELDEYIMHQLLDEGASIDVWGIGTRLVTGAADPALSGVYKIAAKEHNGQLKPCMKLTNTPDKTSNPGSKNSCRFYNQQGLMVGDLIYLNDEADELARRVQDREPITFNHPYLETAFVLEEYAYTQHLLQPVVIDGQRVAEPRSLSACQATVRQGLDSLDDSYKRLINPHRYKVSLSKRLKALKQELLQQIGEA